MKKTLNLAFGVFFFVGLFFIVLGVFFFINTRNNINFSHYVTATIEDIICNRDSDGDINCNTYVSYYVNGVRYDNRIGYYNSSMNIGDKIGIYHDIENPNKTYTRDDYMFGTIFALMGLLFAVIGGTFYIISFRKKRKIENIKKIGIKVNALIDNVEVDTTISVNGQHPYILNCLYYDNYSGLNHSFKSSRIYFSVEHVMNNFNINTVSVYVNPNNYDEYYVDIDELEKYLKS